jgi:hypothetical protein
VAGIDAASTIVPVVWSGEKNAFAGIDVDTIMRPAPIMAPNVMSFESTLRLSDFGRRDEVDLEDAGLVAGRMTGFGRRAPPRGGLTGRTGFGAFGTLREREGASATGTEYARDGCAAGGATSCRGATRGGAAFASAASSARCSRARSSRRVSGAADPAGAGAGEADAAGWAGGLAGTTGPGMRPRRAKPESGSAATSPSDPELQLKSPTSYLFPFFERSISARRTTHGIGVMSRNSSTIGRHG